MVNTSSWMIAVDKNVFFIDLARLPLEDQHCLSAITNDVPLEYLIPTTTGAGALTVSLVDYLILTHNDFIEKCSSKVMAEKSQRYKVLLLVLLSQSNY